MLGTQALGTKDAMAMVAVKDIAKAKAFYGDTLGLETKMGGDEVVGYHTGNSVLLVYKSQFAGTNKATAVTWSVGQDLDGIVQALKSKGVKFEHYDLPGSRREGDIHVMGDNRAVWFKDPEGNILGLVNG